MTSSGVRARMNVTYDAGMFDKDEQGWCSYIHELRVEGDVLHVRRHGDSNGRDPFDSSLTLAIGADDEEAEIVELAGGFVFDLRAQRLLTGSVDVHEEATIPPWSDASGLEDFVARGVTLLRAAGLAPEGVSRLGDFVEQTTTSPDERVRTATLFIDDRAVAELHLTIRASDEVINARLRAGATVRWERLPPDRVVLRGYVAVARVRAVRHALRAMR